MNKCLLMHSNNSMVLWFFGFLIPFRFLTMRMPSMDYVWRISSVYFVKITRHEFGLDTLYGVVCIIFIVILSIIIIITRGSRLIRFFFLFVFVFCRLRKWHPKKTNKFFSVSSPFKRHANAHHRALNIKRFGRTYCIWLVFWTLNI